MTLLERLVKKADRFAATIPVAVRSKAVQDAKQVAAVEHHFPINPDRQHLVVWAALGCPVETPAVSKLIAEIINESK